MNLTLSFRGLTFNHGDDVIFLINKNRTFPLKGKICISKTNKNKFWLCSDDILYNGDTAPDKFNYPYSWVVTLTDKGLPSIPTEIDMMIFPLEKEFEYQETKLSNRLKAFFTSKYPELSELFIYKLGVMDDSELSDGQEGYVNIITKSKTISIKIGRLIKKLVQNFNKISKSRKIECHDAFIEKLHNSWVSFNTPLKYKILKGKDIIEGYSSKDYIKSGNIMSCMIDREHVKYDLYTENPEKISLMIFYLDDKIAGRCVTWLCDDGKTYHDRIYFSYDWINMLILDSLKEMEIQSAKDINNKLKVSVKVYPNVLPYLDTFKVPDKDKKTLKNFYEDTV